MRQMEQSRSNILSYEPNGRRNRRRVGSIVLATGLVIALGAIFLGRDWLVLQLSEPRAAYRYPERRGVESAIRDIGKAVGAYIDTHGSLPDTALKVKPYLVRRRSQWNQVTSESLLPFVTILAADNPATKRIAGGGRFVVIVYLKRAGPMKWDVAVVLGEGDFLVGGNPGLFWDDDIVRNFGTQRLQQLKQNAYQLP